MRIKGRYALLAVGVGTFLALSGCGPASAPPETVAQKVAWAETLVPGDARLAEMYGRSCRGCHITPDAKAPLAGDKTAWDLRFEQGLDVLVAHARDGFKNMPPRGQCLDCTDDDLKHLTLFMAGRGDAGEKTQ